MNNYFIDELTQKPLKIGSKYYIKCLKAKIQDNADKKEIMQNIDLIYDTYLSLKKSLPILSSSQFYCFDSLNNQILIKNRSVKIDDITNHLINVLPDIIEKIISVSNDSNISNIRTKIINIVHNSLIH
jgi:hypothetical protein